MVREVLQVSVPPGRQQSQAPPRATSPGEENRPRSVRGRRGGGGGAATPPPPPPPPRHPSPLGDAAPAGLPWQHPGPTRGLRLPGRGRQAAPGKGCQQASGGRSLRGPRRTWLARLSAGQWRAFHQEGLSPTPGLRRWGLGCERGHSGHLLGS